MAPLPALSQFRSLAIRRSALFLDIEAPSIPTGRFTTLGLQNPLQGVPELHKFADILILRLYNCNSTIVVIFVKGSLRSCNQPHTRLNLSQY